MAFNQDLCEERHEKLDNWRTVMESKMQKASNRTIAILSLLSINLLGIIAALVILLQK